LAGGQEYNKLQQNKVQKIVVDLSKPPPIMTPATEVRFYFIYDFTES
jgi:hypothetical protein